MMDSNALTLAATTITLSALTDAELAEFRLALEWPDPWEQVQRTSWQRHVAALFTDPHYRMPPDVFEAVCTVVTRRLEWVFPPQED